nr:GGDEF domain-containing protein [Kineococcus siccus]
MSLLLRRNRSQAAELAALARTDVLTGLPNRRSGEEELRRHAAEAAASGGPLVVALLDLDEFKRFNDTFGHPAGDALLRGVARVWRAGLAGTGAVLSRWGGEEFLVSVPGRDVDEVEARLERLRAATPHGQSFSAGLARRREGETLQELLVRCDAALYAAKAAGRRRSVVAGGPAGSGGAGALVPAGGPRA